MEELKLSLSGDRKLELIEKFYLRIYKKSFVKYAVSFVLILLLITAYFLENIEEKALLIFLIGIFSLDIILVVSLYVKAKNLAKMSYKLGGINGTINFYETYLEVLTEKSSQKLTYIEAVSAVEYKDMWIVYFGEKKSRVALMIEKDCYTKDEQEQTKNILIDSLYGKNVKCLK